MIKDSDIEKFATVIYYQNLPEAERMLLRLQQYVNGEYVEGVFNALKGICSAVRFQDKSSVIMKIYGNYNPKKIDKLIAKIQMSLNREFISSYEKGYFEAWLQILKTFKKLVEK
ncbi:MAG: hypothetical protein QXY40_01250 [Candidatus Methanomethylicia archaeon]